MEDEEGVAVAKRILTGRLLLLQLALPTDIVVVRKPKPMRHQAGAADAIPEG